MSYYSAIPVHKDIKHQGELLWGNDPRQGGVMQSGTK